MEDHTQHIEIVESAIARIHKSAIAYELGIRSASEVEFLKKTYDVHGDIERLAEHFWYLYKHDEK